MRDLNIRLKCCSIITLLVVFSAFGRPSFGQAPEGQRHQLGLIDMAHVFKNYQKFTDMTAALQAEITSVESEMKTRVESGKKIQEQMKEFAPGSPEFEKLEGDLLTVQADLKKLQLKQQREFMRKEADIYKTTYLEVREAIERYSRYYKYTLILRFDRSGVAVADNPQEIVEGLNQQVLYHRNRDDLTDPILNFLNEQWKRNQQAANPANSTIQ